MIGRNRNTNPLNLKKRKEYKLWELKYSRIQVVRLLKMGDVSVKLGV